MIKDLPKGLLNAVAAINQKSREAYVAEQAEKQKVYESKLAQKMKAPQKVGLSEAEHVLPMRGGDARYSEMMKHANRMGYNVHHNEHRGDERSGNKGKADITVHYERGDQRDTATPASIEIHKGSKAHGDKALTAMVKGKASAMREAAEGTAPKTDKEKQLAAMSGDKTKITKGDVLKARGVKEGWDDMLKATREKSKPQPNGGSGKKQGSSYGGSKQKDEKEVKEDVEQIDELSKSTLGSYVKKASTAMASQNAVASQFRSAGSDARLKAMNAKSDATQDKHARDARVNMSIADRHYAGVGKRQANIGKAVDRLTKEDIDASAAVLRASIQEGVLGTMKKLAKKAVKKVGDTLGHGSDEDLLKDLQKKMGKSNPHGKRSMASEEVDQIDEKYTDKQKALKVGYQVGQNSPYGDKKPTANRISHDFKTRTDSNTTVRGSGRAHSAAHLLRTVKGLKSTYDKGVTGGESAHRKAVDAHVSGMMKKPRLAGKLPEHVEQAAADQIDEALRTISTHGKGEGAHHAVVKRDAEWNEYQVHFYKDGKHMGEGPVSHHDDKKDAQDTAESEVKRMNKKAD
jgi:hypothetical protein